MMLLGGLLEGCSKVVGWFVGRVFKSCWVVCWKGVQKLLGDR